MESYKLSYHPFVKIENKSTELLACRVCLATDSKLFDLHKNRLTLTFGDLTGTQVSKSDGLPQHICHICYILLQKSADFRAKCRRVHMVLQDAMVKQLSLTTAFIETLDRSELKLPFTYTNALTLDFLPESVLDEPLIETNVEPNEHNPLVKDEPFESSDQVLNKWYEPSEIIYEFIEVESKKEDADETNVVLNDWNEPSEVNYEFVGIEAKKEDAKETEKKDKEQIKNSNETFEIYTTEKKRVIVIESKVKKKPARKQRKAPPKLKVERKKREIKRKRPFNMKFIEDFAGFAETYNCEVLFLTKEQQRKEIEERKETEFYKKSVFKCTICYKGFMNVSAHKRHMATHDKANGDHVCDACKARFPVRKHLLQHHHRRHKFSFICKTCNNVSKISTNAKYHFKWHEGFKYECKPCDKQFNTLSTYLNHKRQYHHSVTCEECQETVLGSKGLEEHTLLMHKVTKFPCDACRKQFESQEAFNRHLSSDGYCNIDYPCIKCGEHFASKPQLHDHRETVHQETLFRCDKCPLVFTTARKLAAHWGVAHSETTYICEICAKGFTRKWLLRNHLDQHMDKKPFACTLCPKRFERKLKLEDHMNTHTGERPYKCTQCDASFKSHLNRRKHVLLEHRKERAYKCDMCDKSYVTASDLKLHIRYTHMKIPRPPPNRRSRNNKRNDPINK